MFLTFLKYVFATQSELAVQRPAYLEALSQFAPKLKSKLAAFAIFGTVLPIIALTLFHEVLRSSGHLHSLITSFVWVWMISGAWCMVLLTNLETLEPLNNTKTGCEDAIELINCSKMAKAHRDEVCEKGLQLLEIDLRIMRNFAENESEMEARIALEKEWAMADATQLKQNFQSIFASKRLQRNAVFTIFTFGFLIWIYSLIDLKEAPLHLLIGTSILCLGMGSIVGAFAASCYEWYYRDMLERTGPIWGAPGLKRSSETAFKLIEEFRQEKGQAWAYLQNLRDSNKSLTFADFNEALKKHEAEKRSRSCKQLHLQ